MPAIKNITELKNWIQSTSLNKIQQERFIEMYKENGEWTPEMTEIFVGILSGNIMNATRKVDVATNSLRSTNEEISTIHKNMNDDYKAYMKGKMSEYKQLSKETEAAIEDTKSAYDSAKSSQTADEMNDILSKSL